jgi:hypothetical protein
MITFGPGYNNGPGDAGESWVTLARGWLPGGDPSGYDLAILRLEDPLGDIVGFMGYQSFADEDDYESRSWTTVGYPYVDATSAGNVPMVEFDVEIEDIDADDGFELETDYSKAFGGGWSGGPLWGLIGSGGLIGGDPRVIGVRSGYEVDGWESVRNVWAAGSALVELCRFGRTNWG